MSDNISRHEVIQLIYNSYYNLAESSEDVDSMIEDVEALPSTDRTGHWIDTYGEEWVCSNCGVATHASEDYHSDDVRAYKMNFCHYCGADMRGEQDDSV